MNRCEYCLENLSPYLDGELPESEMKEIEKHLKECDSCSYEFDLLRTIVSTCNELEEELPDGFGSSLHMKLEKARENMLAERNRPGRIKLVSQIAAGFIIVITLGFAVRLGYFGGGIMSGSKSMSDIAPLASSPSRLEYSAQGSIGMKDMGESEIIMEEDAKAKAEDRMAIAQNPETTFDDSDGIGQNDSQYALFFSESASKLSNETSYDTEITIIVDDIDKAIESIIAIDEKVGQSKESNVAYLQESIHAFRGAPRNNFVELKLVYTGEKAQQSFLEEMKSVFSDIQVESVRDEDAGEDEHEYIRVIIEKKK